MTVKLTGSLPDGEGNGLGRIVHDLVNMPHRVHAVIALVDCKRVTTDMDDGSVVPTARVRRIEAVIDPEDKASLRLLLDRAFGARTGQTQLPLELEKDIRAAFDGLDLSTGELPDEQGGE